MFLLLKPEVKEINIWDYVDRAEYGEATKSVSFFFPFLKDKKSNTSRNRFSYSNNNNNINNDKSKDLES